ncbi:MAG: retropepsin-like aspartic protease [Janthinobacterium lividum]
MKRDLWLTVAGCIGALIAPASARPQSKVIPLVFSANAPEAVSARIGDHQGLFLFDSGAGTSAVTPSFSEMIGCKPWGKVTGFRATGERLDLLRCNETDVTVGPITRRMPQLSVIDLKQFMGPAGDKFGGAIALDVFVGHTITLDIAKHRLIIEDAASLDRIKQKAREVPIRLVRDTEGAALTVDLGVPTSLGTAWMEIDTGNYGPSLIDKHVARLVGLAPDKSGAQQWTAELEPNLNAAGSAVVKDLIMDGDIGRDVLMHWSVTLDLANERGWISADQK